MNLRRRAADAQMALHRQLDPRSWPGEGLSPANKFVVVAIVVSCLVAVLESEPTIHEGNETLFWAFELSFGTLFLIEYAARIWVAPVGGRYGHGWRGRLRYAVSPAALFDLVAIMPIFVMAMGPDTFLLRFVRLLRLLRLSRLGAFSAAMNHLGEALRLRRFELLVSVVVVVSLLLFTSTLLYLVEGERQPDVFGSIPRAMWWSLATLTTVGYGDAVPVTALGKFFAGLTAMGGICVIAIPTGIRACQDFCVRAAIMDPMEVPDGTTQITPYP